MEVLVDKWTRKEGTLIHKKFQIRMLVKLLKQTIEVLKMLKSFLRERILLFVLSLQVFG